MKPLKVLNYNPQLYTKSTVIILTTKQRKVVEVELTGGRSDVEESAKKTMSLKSILVDVCVLPVEEKKVVAEWNGMVE